MADEHKQIRVMGIDQSLTNTGIIVLDYSGKILHKELVQPSKIAKDDRNKINRILFIKNKVLELIAQYTPSHIGMEDYSFATKGQAFYLGELGGMIKLIMKENKFPLYVVPPSMVKKFATGNGNADKNLMLKEVFKRWGQDFDNDNVCDAFVIAMVTKAIVDVSKGFRNRNDFNADQWETVRTCISRRINEY